MSMRLCPKHSYKQKHVELSVFCFFFKSFIPPYATLTSQEHTVQKANEGPFLDIIILSGRKVQAYLALFGADSLLLLLSLLSS